jgi:hypothetical protein
VRSKFEDVVWAGAYIPMMLTKTPSPAGEFITDILFNGIRGIGKTNDRPHFWQKP